MVHSQAAQREGGSGLTSTVAGYYKVVYMTLHVVFQGFYKIRAEKFRHKLSSKKDANLQDVVTFSTIKYSYI